MSGNPQTISLTFDDTCRLHGMGGTVHYQGVLDPDYTHGVYVEVYRDAGYLDLVSTWVGFERDFPWYGTDLTQPQAAAYYLRFWFDENGDGSFQVSEDSIETGPVISSIAPAMDAWFPDMTPTPTKTSSPSETPTIEEPPTGTWTSTVSVTSTASVTESPTPTDTASPTLTSTPTTGTGGSVTIAVSYTGSLTAVSSTNPMQMRFIRNNTLSMIAWGQGGPNNPVTYTNTLAAGTYNIYGYVPVTLPWTTIPQIGDPYLFWDGYCDQPGTDFIVTAGGSYSITLVFGDTCLAHGLGGTAHYTGPSIVDAYHRVGIEVYRDAAYTDFLARSSGQRDFTFGIVDLSHSTPTGYYVRGFYDTDGDGVLEITDEHYDLGVVTSSSSSTLSLSFP